MAPSPVQTQPPFDRRRRPARPSPAEVASRGRYSLVAAAFLAVWFGAIAASGTDLGPLNALVGTLLFLAVVSWGLLPFVIALLAFILACSALSGWSANVIGRPSTVPPPPPRPRRQLAWGLWGAIAGFLVTLGPLLFLILLWARSGLSP